MIQTQTIGTIRDRGQITIPDKVRQAYDWATPGSVVTISAVKPTEITIKPYSPVNSKRTDWGKLWNEIELARSYKGTYSGSLSKLVADDRKNHD